MIHELAGLIALLIFSAAAESDVGTRGGQVTTVDGHKYEVVVAPESQEVNVYTEDRGDALPGKMVVAVKKEDQVLDRVNVELMKDPRQNGTARFQGNLGEGLRNQSFVGIQFVIELDRKKAR